MATNDEADEAMRWLARTLSWERRIDGIRYGRSTPAVEKGDFEIEEVEMEKIELQEIEAQAVEVQAVEVRPEPAADPIGLREPERTPFDAPRVRVPQRDHRVA